MKKTLNILALVLALSASAWAQTATPNPITVNRLVGLGMRPELASFVASLTTVKSNAEWIAASNAAGSGTLYMVRADTSDNTVINAATSKKISLQVATTPVAIIGSTGFSTAPFAVDATFISGTAPRLAAYVPTMASTPVAGTNDFKIGLNVVPTAAANTSALFPTPAAVGQMIEVVNDAGAAVRLKPGSTNTINGGSGGAYIPLAVSATAKCRSVSTTGWYCGTQVVPTPAGP